MEYLQIAISLQIRLFENIQGELKSGTIGKTVLMTTFLAMTFVGKEQSGVLMQKMRGILPVF